jgi:hypothetical protein
VGAFGMDARVVEAVKPATETVKRELRVAAADPLQGLERFEADLWKITDTMRANSNLASNQYFMPIMGLIFLRHATNRFYETKTAIEADIAAGRMPKRPLRDADFTKRRALNLPEAARFDVIRRTPKSEGRLGAAVNAAMEAIEATFPPLADQLPKEYGRFEDDVLEGMMTGFDVESLSTLYIDKPMKAHTLMQAIARANRVYPGKDFGLIIDYNGMLKSLRAALAQYALGDDGTGAEEIVAPIDERVQALIEAINATEAHLKGLGFDAATLKGAGCRREVTLPSARNEVRSLERIEPARR